MQPANDTVTASPAACDCGEACFPGRSHCLACDAREETRRAIEDFLAALAAAPHATHVPTGAAEGAEPAAPCETRAMRSRRRGASGACEVSP